MPELVLDKIALRLLFCFGKYDLHWKKAPPSIDFILDYISICGGRSFLDRGNR